MYSLRHANFFKSLVLFIHLTTNESSVSTFKKRKKNERMMDAFSHWIRRREPGNRIGIGMEKNLDANMNIEGIGTLF